MRLELGGDRGSPAAHAEISFDLPHPTIVSVTVEDAEEDVFEVLIEGLMPEGHHDLTWSGSLPHGHDFFLVVDTPTSHKVEPGHSIRQGH